MFISFKRYISRSCTHTRTHTHRLIAHSQECMKCVLLISVNYVHQKLNVKIAFQKIIINYLHQKLNVKIITTFITTLITTLFSFQPLRRHEILITSAKPLAAMLRSRYTINMAVICHSHHAVLQINVLFS